MHEMEAMRLIFVDTNALKIPGNSKTNSARVRANSPMSLTSSASPLLGILDCICIRSLEFIINSDL